MTTPTSAFPDRPGPEHGEPRIPGGPLGFRLGRILGFEVRMDPSVIVIAFLVAFNLAAGALPAWHPDWHPALVWLIAILAALLLFASILAHELSHALVGRHYGLPIRRITLFIFGGTAELEREPDRPKVELLMAAAGPAFSLVFGFATAFAGGMLARHEIGAMPSASDLERLGPVSTLLLWLGPVNMTLGFFNLLPGFPLDGGRVLRAVLWWKTKRLESATRWATRAGQAVAALLAAAGITMIFGHRVPLLGAGFVQGLWLVLIGWFLNTAALRSYAQMVQKMRHFP